MSNRIHVSMGALCEPIELQLNRQGLTLGTDECIQWVHRCDKAITHLGIHGLLTESERDRARKRLMKEISESVKPLPTPQQEPTP